MDLSFVVSAVKRYWWLALGGLLIGSAIGVTLRGETETVYQSRALLYIAPPSVSPATGGTSSDRYVAGQLLVLGSYSAAEDVAETVGEGQTADSILATLSVIQAQNTDIVELTVSTPEARLSQKIAVVYVQQYFSKLQTQVDGTRNSSLAGVDAKLVVLQEQLTAIDAAIAAAMAPYLPPAGCTTSCPPIPPIEQVVPNLVSQKQAVLSQIQNVTATKNQLELGDRVRVASQVVQDATLPTAPLVSSNRKILAAGVLGGLVLGLVLAVFAARVSRKVLDNEEASEILQVPVVGSVPSYRISSDRRAVIEYLPASATPFIDHLRVRTDALDRRHHSLIVLVTGTDVSVGTTSLAGALANRFALNGAEVIVVDADPLHPELSELFELQPAGLPAYVGGPPRAPGVAALLRPTRVPSLQVVAAADMMEGSSVLRREDVPKLLARLDPLADVIIVDGGPFLGAASTVQFAHIADAVVLAIPKARQQKQALALIGRELREQQPNVLAVTTPSSPPRRR
ncbi:MAG: hypothetical protein ABL953_05725 [Ilumatobacteraceae bacterium]